MPTSTLLAADSDVFRLVLTGGVGIIVFAIVNALVVGAVARGDWESFEEEAAAWIDEDPDMAELQSKLLSDADFESPSPPSVEPVQSDE